MYDVVTLPINRPDPPSVPLWAIAWFILQDRAACYLLEEQMSGHMVPRYIPGQLFICSAGTPHGYPEFEHWQDRGPEAGFAFRVPSHALIADLGWLWRDATIIKEQDDWLREILEEDARQLWVDEAGSIINDGSDEFAIAEALRFRSHASRYGLVDRAGNLVRPASELIREAPWYLPPKPEEQEGEIARHPDGWLLRELDEFHVITW